MTQTGRVLGKAEGKYPVYRASTASTLIGGVNQLCFKSDSGIF